LGFGKWQNHFNLAYQIGFGDLAVDEIENQ
jgi:hypothetical protein